jgi:uncharacterized integral membrane protein
LTIEFDLFLDDMTALANYHSDRSHAERRRRLVVQVLILVVFVLLVASAISSARNAQVDWTPFSLGVAFLPVLCPAILLVLVFAPAVRHWQTRRAVHKAFKETAPGETVGRQRLTLTSEALVVKTQVADMTVPWADIEDITTRDAHAFVYTTADQALVIPRRAFPDPATFDGFMETVERYRAASAG